ncbi:MAG: helix-turn-helix domain-containing protein [Bacillota bacterium]|nr:helix-turn-helix domain-containing protein [Bacillota bacterium]
MNTERLLLTVSEAAEQLNVSRSHLYGLVQQGMVPTIRLGRSVRIPREWLSGWVAAQVQDWEQARWTVNERER